jgi:acyl carrier protein
MEIGRYWAQGGEVEWKKFTRLKPGRRLSLPTYPFNRRVIWFEAPVNKGQVSSPTSAGSTWGHAGAFPEDEIQALLDKYASKNGNPEGGGSRPEESRVADSGPVKQAHPRGLRALVVELLGTDDVDMGLSFVDAGGDSLLGVQFVGKIKATYGVDVNAEELFAGSMNELEARLNIRDQNSEIKKTGARDRKPSPEKQRNLVDQLCRICCATLKLEEVDRLSSFMDCGGDSISAGEFVWSVRNETGLALDIDDVLSKPLAALAD